MAHALAVPFKRALSAAELEGVKWYALSCYSFWWKILTGKAYHELCTARLQRRVAVSDSRLLLCSRFGEVDEKMTSLRELLGFFSSYHLKLQLKLYCIATRERCVAL